ncbi:hypothetical protein [Mycobacterium lepromatosis]|uniref:hypothetical protein n=1 Tax=Mycobacterium lepromatosis TaxID=480418 RepID=UPI0012E0BD0C
MCIGERFAGSEATVGLVKFIRRAAVQLLADNFPLVAAFTVFVEGSIRTHNC